MFSYYLGPAKAEQKVGARWQDENAESGQLAYCCGGSASPRAGSNSSDLLACGLLSRSGLKGLSSWLFGDTSNRSCGFARS